MTGVADDLNVRPATLEDRDAIVQLATRTLGWLGDDGDMRFFEWKHDANPFGASPMWVACIDDRVVGFRTFLRWEFTIDGQRVRAVRAVDTATDPDHQSRGIFTRLTLTALDDLRADGVDMVFNTPNAQSLPGYLKMGWREVGRPPVAIMPTSAHSLFTLRRARVPASLSAVHISAGEHPHDAFADSGGLATLLETIPAPGLVTAKTPEFFTWRYGYEPLQYRVVQAGAAIGDGFAVFHLRRRGPALEAVLCDTVVPEPDGVEGRRTARHLARQVARLSGADYLLRLDRRVLTSEPFVRVPRTGPVLTFRPLDGLVPPPLHRWNLDMGDIELF